MTYTVFLNRDQNELLSNLSNGGNEIIESAMKRMVNQSENVFCAEFTGFSYYLFVLTIKALDKSRILTRRLVELGQLQDDTFSRTLELYERELIKAQYY